MLPQYSKLAGKKVLLIGGTSGIGFATAALVLEHHGLAILSSSQPSKIASAIQRLRTTYPEAADRIAGFPCDLADAANLDANLTALFDFATAFRPSSLGPGPRPVPKPSDSDQPAPTSPIHHVAFTAGNAAPIVALADASLAALANLAAVRYVAAVFVAKHAARYLAPGPESSIVLTTNVSDVKPGKGWALSTGATSLAGLVRGAAVDLAPVRVNCVKVGWVETERLWAVVRAAGDAGDEGEVRERGRRMLEERAGQTLTGRVAGPESVAEAYLYFMKDWNVTGQSIVTDGGFTLT